MELSIRWMALYRRTSQACRALGNLSRVRCQRRAEAFEMSSGPTRDWLQSRTALAVRSTVDPARQRRSRISAPVAILATVSRSKSQKQCATAHHISMSSPGCSTAEILRASVAPPFCRRG